MRRPVRLLLTGVALTFGAAALPAQSERLRPPEPPTEAEQHKALAEVAEYALNYSEKLPNFICVQVTRRYLDPSGTGDQWRQTDTYDERLSYFDQKETYSVLSVNHQLVTSPVDRRKLGGATSSGEFGTILRGIFAPNTQAEINWERWGTLRGRRMHVFSFRVPQERSNYSIHHEASGRTVIAGYAGLLYVDRESGAVTRIRLICDNIPDFPIQNVSLLLDYDFSEISGHRYLLPLRAELQSREDALLVRNEVEFRLYRKFEADSTITFDRSGAER